MVMNAAQSRSSLYSRFGAYMAFPTARVWQESLCQNAFTLLEGTGKGLPYAFYPGTSGIQGSYTLDDLEQAFTVSFDTGAAAVSLHGRSYTNDGDQKLFEELFRFYEHFGLDFSSSNNDFWPDALEVELEFMHYLTYLEGLAGENRLPILKAQRDFLTRHLRPLLAGIKASLVEKNTPVYAQLATLLNEFVEADHVYLNEVIGDQISVKQIA
jgi:DMSO reductase family type II enzyme chaperone